MSFWLHYALQVKLGFFVIPGTRPTAAAAAAAAAATASLKTTKTLIQS